jgi:hypothetical protein
MKRRVSTRRQQRTWSYDVRKDLTQEQLAGIGAMALAWNDAEAMYDLLLCVSLGLNHNLWREVAPRFNGIEGKHEIIRQSFLFRQGLGAGFITDLIENTIGGVGELRGYRDAVIHSRVIDVNLQIGESASRRGGKIDEVLLTEKALSGLCDRMTLIRQELQHLISWVEAIETLRTYDTEGKPVVHLAMQNLFARLTAMAEGKPGIIVSSDLSSSTEEIGLRAQDALAQYQHYQARRRSLPPLPSFPKEDDGKPIRPEEPS